MRLDDVRTWKQARGKAELIRHLHGKTPLTMKQAVVANCYQCNAGYTDGKVDCQMEECPLHPFMPYVKGGARKRKSNLSDEQRQERSKRMSGIRSRKATLPKTAD